MNSSRTILELRFSSSAKQFNPIPEIVRILGGGEVKNNIPFDPVNFRLQLQDKRISLYLNAARYAINIEENNLSLDQIKNTVIDISKKLTDHIRWGDVTRIGFRTTWLHKVDDFSELVQKSKEILFTSNKLVERAMDVAMPLTFNNNGDRIDYNYGPMKKGELAKFGFEFPLDTPDYFVYIDVDYNRAPNQSISSAYLRDFLKVASNYSSDIVSETITLLGV